MEIDSRFAGTPLRDYHANIHWRHTMNYAAALEDYNPHYFDDDSPEGIVAHPMFCVAVTWPMLDRIWEYIKADGFPHHLLRAQVHYTEHLSFHRPLLPGDSLVLKGKIAAVLPHRVGAYMITRIDALDQDGALTFSEHTGVIIRGVECTDGGRGGEDLPATPASPAEAKPIWEAVVPIEPLRPFIYDGCTGITFPIHTSEKFAREVGLPGIILQGTATLGFAVRELINREADGDPRALGTLSARFTSMVFPGTDIRVQLTGEMSKANGRDLYFAVLNAEGHKAISDGYAFLKAFDGA